MLLTCQVLGSKITDMSARWRETTAAPPVRRVPGRGGDLVRQLVWLYVGLAAFGFSLALMVEAELGVGPWDLLHQGLARRLGLPLGSVVIAVSMLVLLLWVPLRQRPGIGTA